MSDNSTFTKNNITDTVNILLVIDLQKEFKDNHGQYEKVLQFIKEHKTDYDYVVGTGFKNHPDSMYVRHLGYTDCMYISEDSSKIDYPEPEYEYDALFMKQGYSISVRDIIDFLCDVVLKRRVRGVLRSHFDIVGCDADACVLATAFSIWDSNNDFRILSDYIYTTSNDFSKEDVLKIMRRNFGDCVV